VILFISYSDNKPTRDVLLKEDFIGTAAPPNMMQRDLSEHSDNAGQTADWSKNNDLESL
jgi:hypothetical protein